jgi:N-acetylmuramoyl-L-alanine amidase
LGKFFGGRAASAVIGLFAFGIGSSAAAQTADPAALIGRTVATTTTAVVSSVGTVTQATPAKAVTMKLAPSIAREAAWLHKAGWPLYALAEKYSVGDPLDEQANCLATAVYFEARGESVEGQLAVARVVMNRAASGRYPPDWCSVMKQPWQFSFVNPRTGQYPSIDTTSAAWARAQGIARLAVANVVPSIDDNVLWYHATYVAPSWGRRLAISQKIGAHIFYRS